MLTISQVGDLRLSTYLTRLFTAAVFTAGFSPDGALRFIFSSLGALCCSAVINSLAVMMA